MVDELSYVGLATVDELAAVPGLGVLQANSMWV